MPRQLRMEYPAAICHVLNRGERRKELPRRGWKGEDWPGLRKGDKRKAAPSRRLRKETTTSLKRIAQELPMGSCACVSNLLHEKQHRRIVVNSEH